MVFNGIRRDSMVFSGIRRDSMVFNGIRRDSMVFNGTGRSKETVTYNISLTDLKKRKMAKLNDFWQA